VSFVVYLVAEEVTEFGTTTGLLQNMEMEWLLVGISG
jgi:hypothetical protein